MDTVGAGVSSVCFRSDEHLLDEKWKSGCVPKDKLFCENLAKSHLPSEPQVPP